MDSVRITFLGAAQTLTGSRGRALADGAEELKIFGRYVPVRARVERRDVRAAAARGDLMSTSAATLRTRPPNMETLATFLLAHSIPLPILVASMSKELRA